MSTLYLFDIEGTTTDISFVHKVLFPYSLAHLESFVLNHQAHPVVVKSIYSVSDTVWSEEKKKPDLYGVIAKLGEWIRKDRKHGALKDIQGLIWDEGYAKKAFQGHVYPDVKPFFEKLRAAGKRIGIYSSGSVHAQKLIFGNSLAGDLTPFISCYFDTKVGGKREKGSYEKIAAEVGLPASEIHFFSDIPEELQSARDAGMEVTQVLRPGTKPAAFRAISSFQEVSL